MFSVNENVFTFSAGNTTIDYAVPPTIKDHFHSLLLQVQEPFELAQAFCNVGMIEEVARYEQEKD